MQSWVLTALRFRLRVQELVKNNTRFKDKDKKGSEGIRLTRIDEEEKRGPVI